MANQTTTQEPIIQIDEAGRIIVADAKTREALVRVLSRLAANPDSVTGNDRCTSFNNDCRPVRD
jgi:hypothetical protein